MTHIQGITNESVIHHNPYIGTHPHVIPNNGTDQDHPYNGVQIYCPDNRTDFKTILQLTGRA